MNITQETLLPLLAAAGDEGMTTIEMALAPQFAGTYGSAQGRSNRVSAVLAALERRGVTERIGYGQSPLYHRQPVNRWRAVQPAATYYLTPSQRATLRRERSHERQRERAADAQRRALLAAGAFLQYDRRTPRCVRERACRELRAQGLTLEQIGAIFGITRERARQIIAGIKPGQCRCADCLKERFRFTL